jgi:trimeric autotransporter adhesin
VVIKRLFVLVAAASFGACTLDKTPIPSLSGPSELGLSISITASPDQLPEDGQSTSTITVVARDANSQPVSGLMLKGDILAGGLPTDVKGTLSSHSISTNNSGVATVIFTAPVQAATDPSHTTIAVSFTPVDGNFANAQARNVSLDLSLPSVIVLPGLSVKFTFSNGALGTHFDASGTTATAGRTIVSYDWDFGDGSAHGSGVTTDHAYAAVPGQASFVVTLRVTDSAGQTGFATQTIRF